MPWWGASNDWSSGLSTLMIDIPGDLVWDLPCVQQASYLEGGPLMWMLPLYLHVNQKSDYDDMIYEVCLPWGLMAESFHSLQSLSVSCFCVILGLPGPCFPSTCMSTPRETRYRDIGGCEISEVNKWRHPATGYVLMHFLIGYILIIW